MDGVCNQNWTTHPLDNPWTTSPQSLGNLAPKHIFPTIQRKTWPFCSSAPAPAEGFFQFISCEIDKLKSCNISLPV